MHAPQQLPKHHVIATQASSDDGVRYHAARTADGKLAGFAAGLGAVRPRSWRTAEHAQWFIDHAIEQGDCVPQEAIVWADRP